MPRNLYADLDQWERRFSYDADLGGSDRTELERIMETAARDVDVHVNTQFFAETATLTFDGSGSSALWVPDLLAVTSIKLDENRDRVYEITLAAADFYLTRPDHPRPYDATPKRRVLLDGWNGAYSVFLHQEKLVQIAGEWGYTNATEDTGQTVQNGGGQSAAALTLTVTDGTKLSVGQTLKIESEQQYVSAIAANVATVARGVNGTAAASHAMATVINRYVYLPEVRDACLIQSIRAWKRKEVGFIDRQSPSPFQGLDPDAERLLTDLVRYDV